MVQNLKLHKLVLKGYRKDYLVPFKSGLNFITGPISTGKSSILEFVNYALGSKSHKDYLEVKSSCTDVELYFDIKGIPYKIVRPLFYFDRPIKIYEWNYELDAFEDNFLIFEISSPLNSNSLSSFLLEKLNVPKITIANQAFSFRDLFKYCYVNQSSIDSENLLDEKNSSTAFKRKPTLEVILNSLNQLLHQLRELKKQKKEDIQKFYDKKNAIVDFVKSVELLSNPQKISEEKQKLENRKIEILEELNQLKNNSKTKDDFTKSLEARLFILNNEIGKLNQVFQDVNSYKGKLSLLRNQYNNELIKYDYLLMAHGQIQELDFIHCPSCSGEIKKGEYGKCCLCGSSINDLDAEEENAIKLEKKRLKSKINELIDFIEKQEADMNEILNNRSNLIKKRAKTEEKINSLQQVYLSPFISKIEELNREVGEIDKQIENIVLSEKVHSELLGIISALRDEEVKLEELNAKIKSIEEENEDFNQIIQQLSTYFFKTLAAFEFPKLKDAYISDKNYLPYVRNVKYDELGSGGAVTLITIGYFLSILKISLQLKQTYHPGILMLDTIGKNLGTSDISDSEDEFKDSKIFRLLVKHLADFAELNENNIQLIVINNNTTTDVKEEDVIMRFDGDGTKGIKYGLIDDLGL